MTLEQIQPDSGQLVGAMSDTDSWVGVVADVAKLATHISDTEFVPKGLRGKPAAVAAAMLSGREIGLPPMTALQVTHVIEGKPGLSAEGMRALVFAAGHVVEFVESTGATCTIRGRRRFSETWTEVTWTLDMARAAGLAQRPIWKTYPRTQLQARATTELCRMIFPDVIHGFRSVEELDDMAGENGEASPDAAAGAVSRATPRRARKTAAKKSAPASSSSSSVSEQPVHVPPPLPGEPGFDEASPPVRDAGADDALPTRPAPASSDKPTEQPTVEPPKPALPRRVTRAQIRMLQARFNELGLHGDDDRPDRIKAVERIVGRDIDSTTDLTVGEAATVLDTLARMDTLEDLRRLLTAVDDAADQTGGREADS